MQEQAFCLCGRPSRFITGPQGEPHYAVEVCEDCLAGEAHARDVVSECEHQPRNRGGYVMCPRCGAMQCQDGTWLHPFAMPRLDDVSPAA
jgi:hypothetical protein